MLNITTKYTTTAKGEGRIVAKGAGKQYTMPYDHSLSVNANHGSAAGVLARKVLPQDKWNEAGNKAVHIGFADGSHRFNIDL